MFYPGEDMLDGYNYTSVLRRYSGSTVKRFVNLTKGADSTRLRDDFDKQVRGNK